MAGYLLPSMEGAQSRHAQCIQSCNAQIISTNNIRPADLDAGTNNMKIGPRNAKQGAFAARQMGAEFQANPGSSRGEYLDSSAFYFREGVESFSQLTDEEKTICRREFNAGIAQEKSLQ